MNNYLSYFENGGKYGRKYTVHTPKDKYNQNWNTIKELIKDVVNKINKKIYSGSNEIPANNVVIDTDNQLGYFNGVGFPRLTTDTVRNGNSIIVYNTYGTPQ